MADDSAEEAELARLEEAEQDQRPPVTIETVQRDMLAMERRHAEELANLRRQNPPPRELAPEPPKEDIGQMLFNEPQKAIQRIREEVSRDIENKLTQRYVQDQNNIRFWTTFDEKFPDLKNDRDLAEMTMNANISELANIPVDEAMEKIAELTRGRIQRYTKSRPQGRRPYAEGASPPMPPRQAAEDEKPPSLSEIVRRRRAAKQNRATVA